MTDFGSILGDVLKNYASGGVPQTPSDVQNVPHNEVYNHYQQYVQQAPPQQVYDAHQQAAQQIPQDQRQDIFSSLLGALGQHGISPQEIGVQGSSATPSNLAQVAQYVSQNPGLMQRIFGQNGALNSPLAKMLLAGALAVAADQFTKRGGFGGLSGGSQMGSSNKGSNKDSGSERIV